MIWRKMTKVKGRERREVNNFRIPAIDVLLMTHSMQGNVKSMKTVKRVMLMEKRKRLKGYTLLAGIWQIFWQGMTMTRLSKL